MQGHIWFAFFTSEHDQPLRPRYENFFEGYVANFFMFSYNSIRYQHIICFKTLEYLFGTYISSTNWGIFQEGIFLDY